MVSCIKMPQEEGSAGATLSAVRQGVVERMFRSHVEDLGRLQAAYHLNQIDRMTFIVEAHWLIDILATLREDGPAENALKHAEDVILSAVIGDDPLPPDPQGPEEIDIGKPSRGGGPCSC